MVSASVLATEGHRFESGQCAYPQEKVKRKRHNQKNERRGSDKTKKALRPGKAREPIKRWSKDALVSAYTTERF